MSSYFFLASMFFDEKLAVNLIEDPLHIMSLFFLDFKILSFVFFFL